MRAELARLRGERTELLRVPHGGKGAAVSAPPHLAAIAPSAATREISAKITAGF